MNKIFLLLCFIFWVSCQENKVVEMSDKTFPQDKANSCSLKKKESLKNISLKKKNLKGEKMSYNVVKTEEQWRKLLTPQQYHITREKGTERAFTGKYYNLKETGTYKCVCCGEELFGSDAKYNSGSGWPSFWKPLKKENIHTIEDHSFGMTRVEIVCKNCGAHLGHIFDDGPAPTNQRYCVNSASLKFEKK